MTFHKNTVGIDLLAGMDGNESRRCSTVIFVELGTSASDGTLRTQSGSGYDIAGRRTFATWLHSPRWAASSFQVHLETSAGRKALVYRADVAGSTLSGDDYIVGLDGKAGDFNEGRWVRLERDLAADAAAAWPAATVTRVTGIRLVAVDDDLKMDGLSFSNALTVQRNVLQSGVIGHIVASRDTDTGTWAETVRHPHYDQVGTVTGWSDAAGAGFAASHSDAWGNAMASWTTGRWAPAGGWLHNTKETDADLGLVYMYQRWYDPATGTFSAAAVFPGEMEHPYSFAHQIPVHLLDPEGEFLGVIVVGAVIVTGAIVAYNQLGKFEERVSTVASNKQDMIDCASGKCPPGLAQSSQRKHAGGYTGEFDDAIEAVESIGRAFPGSSVNPYPRVPSQKNEMASHCTRLANSAMRNLNR